LYDFDSDDIDKAVEHPVPLQIQNSSLFKNQPREILSKQG